MANQYENQQNVQAPIRTTSPEKWKHTGGRVTHVIFSLGTCGTVTGTAKFLRKNPNTQIIAVQPSETHDVPGLRNVAQLEVTKLYARSLIDEILKVDSNCPIPGRWSSVAAKVFLPIRAVD